MLIAQLLCVCETKNNTLLKLVTMQIQNHKLDWVKLQRETKECCAQFCWRCLNSVMYDIYASPWCLRNRSCEGGRAETAAIGLSDSYFCSSSSWVLLSASCVKDLLSCTHTLLHGTLQQDYRFASLRSNCVPSNIPDLVILSYECISYVCRFNWFCLYSKILLHERGVLNLINR